MIPKVIHYCWYGGKKKSKLINDCIASWKKILPDYEIIEWNESNSNLSTPFVKSALKEKKWAFIADYIRLKVLYEHGGIYLDTDMMVVKNFDNLLNTNCFFGAENLEYISCGIIGAKKNNSFIKECLNFYSDFKFPSKLDLGINTIPQIITKIFRKNYNFNENFATIVQFENLIIYPTNYFYSLPYKESQNIKRYKEYLKPESYAVHLWNSSWVDHSEFYYLRRRKYIKGFNIVLKSFFKGKNINFKYFKKIASCIKESLKY